MSNRRMIGLLICLFLSSCGEKSTVLNRRTIAPDDKPAENELDAKQVDIQQASSTLESADCDLTGYTDELPLAVVQNLDLSKTSFASWCQALSQGDLLLVQYVSDQSASSAASVVNMQLTLQYSALYAKIRHIVASSAGDSDLSTLHGQMPAYIAGNIILAQSSPLASGPTVLGMGTDSRTAVKVDKTPNLEFLRVLEALAPEMAADVEASPFLQPAALTWPGTTNLGTQDFDVIGMR